MSSPVQAHGARASLGAAPLLAGGALLVLPLAGLGVLLARPALDVRWLNLPAHFWIVLIAGALNAALAYGTGVAARRRRDARVLLVSLAFLAAAGFLGLHALATPGVLLERFNAGFVLATPIGLVVASIFAAASSLDLSGPRGAALVRRARLLQNGLVALMVAWGAVSVAAVGPLSGTATPERASGSLLVVAAAGVGLYALAVARYLALARRRGSSLVLGMAAACALLAEAMVAVAFGRNWHATWWEWHVLMLLAFLIVAWSAQRQWHEERFGDLYLDETAAGAREISVLFADLAGFTSFSERRDPREVSEMLNAYFESAIPPIVRRHGGEVDRIIGDALMVTFNRGGDQPDHAAEAARAALALQEATSAIAAEHPEWPRFRVGVNTGEALVGVLGTGGGRTYTAVGDTVNLAARLEAEAPVGGVVLGPDTVARVPEAVTELLGTTAVKGKDAPVEVHRLLALRDRPGAPAAAGGSEE